jgi:probable F420-dependent oxidoreductase
VTGIVILPQRNPVVLAKQVASLDVLSGGRVTLGVGAGYLEPEFRAIGANYAERGAVTDEYIDAMRSLWDDPQPAYHGRFVDFVGVDAYPRPVQRRLPLVIGGHTPPAYRRAVARGDGWYGYGLTPERAAECVSGLKAAAARVQRPAGLGELEVSVTPRGEITRELVARFAEAGVHRLVMLVDPEDDGPERAIESGAAAVAGL